jgi:ankyrin repeat protein
LLDAGADPEVRDLAGNGVLHAAADVGSEEMVKLLLPRVKNPLAPNRAGQTAKDLALAHGHSGIVKLLEAPPRGSGGANFGTRPDDDVRDNKALR